MINIYTIKFHNEDDKGIFISLSYESGFKTLLPRLIKFSTGYILYLTLLCVGITYKKRYGLIFGFPFLFIELGVLNG